MKTNIWNYNEPLLPQERRTLSQGAKLRLMRRADGKESVWMHLPVHTVIILFWPNFPGQGILSVSEQADESKLITHSF